MIEMVEFFVDDQLWMCIHFAYLLTSHYLLYLATKLYWLYLFLKSSMTGLQESSDGNDVYALSESPDSWSNLQDRYL